MQSKSEKPHSKTTFAITSSWHCMALHHATGLWAQRCGRVPYWLYFCVTFFMSVKPNGKGQFEHVISVQKQPCTCRFPKSFSIMEIPDANYSDMVTATEDKEQGGSGNQAHTITMHGLTECRDHFLIANPYLVLGSRPRQLEILSVGHTSEFVVRHFALLSVLVAGRC